MDSGNYNPGEDTNGLSIQEADNCDKEETDKISGALAQIEWT